jgi:hypothetical protein
VWPDLRAHGVLVLEDHMRLGGAPGWRTWVLSSGGRLQRSGSVSDGCRWLYGGSFREVQGLALVLLLLLAARQS